MGNISNEKDAATNRGCCGPKCLRIVNYTDCLFRLDLCADCLTSSDPPWDGVLCNTDPGLAIGGPYLINGAVSICGRAPHSIQLALRIGNLGDPFNGFRFMCTIACAQGPSALLPFIRYVKAANNLCDITGTYTLPNLFGDYNRCLTSPSSIVIGHCADELCP